MKMHRLVFSCSLVFAALLLGSALDVQACMVPDPPPGCEICSSEQCCITDGSSTTCYNCEEQLQGTTIESPPTILNFLSNRRVLITLSGYKTTNLQPTNSCVVAISPVPGLGRVNSVKNADSRTGKPFAEVSFIRADAPGRAIVPIARERGFSPVSGAPWHGFVSRIVGEVPSGVPNHFVIDVTLEEGTDLAAFVQALEAQGIFATGPALSGGTPDEGHQYFRRIGRSEIMVLFPADRGGKRSPDPRVH